MGTNRYQIIISGRLGVVGREAFRDFRIDPHGPDTALTGDLNRSGLHDVLIRIRDLALELVGFIRLTPEPDTKHQTDGVKRPGAPHNQAGERPASPAAGDAGSVLTVDRPAT